MITTLTINAAVDYTVETSQLEIGAVNSVEFRRKDAAGKGINVAKDVVKLGQKAKAIACLGGSGGEYINRFLEKRKIPADISWIDGETRTNLKVVDESGDETKINQQGANISEDVLVEVKKKVLDSVATSEVIVLAGSLPPSIPQDFYHDLIKEIGQDKVKVFLDTSGQPLKSALEVQPTLIKPNIHELEEIYEQKMSQSQVIEVGQKLVKQGIKLVLVSLGSEGAILVTEGQILQANPPVVDPVSTVGAGDSMVAGMAVSYLEDKSPVDMLKFATAVSVATILQPGSEVGGLEETKEVIDQVEIKKL
ncbi:1-phosphofructokinase [Halanaerocella petrolearia]